MTKDCLRCGRSFEARSSKRKYCKYACFVRDNPKQFPAPESAINSYTIAQDEINETIERIKTSKTKGVFY